VTAGAERNLIAVCGRRGYAALDLERREVRRVGETHERILLVASVATVTVLVAVYALLRTRPDYEWPTSLLAMVPGWLWPIAPLVLGVWAALAHAWALTGLNGAALILSTFLLAGLTVPGTAPPTADASPLLRIATWNVRYEDGHADAIETKLLGFAPDIICLQESHREAFDDLLPGWHRAAVDDVPEHGIRIFSRYPIAHAETVGPAGDELRPSLICTITTPHGPLTVASVHLAASHAVARVRETCGLSRMLADGALARRRQVQALLAALPDDHPFVVAGDHNAQPVTALYRTLARRMTDAFAVSGLGFGYSLLAKDRLPVGRIDYIWCGNGVRPVRCRVGHSCPSDHRPVVADVLRPVHRREETPWTTACSPSRVRTTRTLRRRWAGCSR